MKFTLETPTSLSIRSVSDDEIRIGDQRWSEPVAMTSEGVLGAWPPKPVAQLDADDFVSLVDTRPEIIVLGTGATHRLPPRDVVFALARKGIGFEVMDTRAAARTFNVLVGEGRRVAAVLYV